MITAIKLRPNTKFAVSKLSGIYVKIRNEEDKAIAKKVFGDSPEDVGQEEEIDGNLPCYILPTEKAKNPKTFSKKPFTKEPMKRPPHPEHLFLSVINEENGVLLTVDHPSTLQFLSYAQADSLRITEGEHQGEYEVSSTAFDINDNHFYVVVGNPQ